ncbi:hypothetical protein ACHAXN_004193 [Cyclotella atomus]
MTKPPSIPPLPVSQTEDGSLATAPLSTVINAATNDLYQDFYNLVHAEIPIVTSSAITAANSADAAAKSPGKDNDPSSSTVGGVGASSSNNETQTKKLRMSALSFAQRRHELHRRLLHHIKSTSHLYALSASSLPNSHSALTRTNNRDSLPRLGATVSSSSEALKFVRNAWQSADEAQDALYFHHDGLWRSREHVHDVLGAMMVYCGGIWGDFPSDVALLVDRYENSKECGYSVEELERRLGCGVRRKLVCGEVGEFGVVDSGVIAKCMNGGGGSGSHHWKHGGDDEMPLPWKVTVEPGGTAIRLTYGAPRVLSTAEALRQSLTEVKDTMDTTTDVNSSSNNNNNLQQYPMEARLSILSETDSPYWKLLSVQVQCCPKTGESNHQIKMNKKQMFDLHRIGERVMIVEEAVCKKIMEEEQLQSAKNQSGDDDGEVDKARDTNATTIIDTEKKSIVPRPLLRLFEVTHSFALSMQLEMLSSQAEALRRGAWGGFVGIPTANAAATARVGDGIAVSAAHFFEEKRYDGCIAVMAVHFWSCDDRFGSPKVGDLSASAATIVNQSGVDPRGDKMETASSTASVSYSKMLLDRRPDDNYLPNADCRGEKRLSLCIRAVPMVGLVVSLSGGSDVALSLTDSNNNSDHHMKRNLDKLLSSIQDPFQLSMSDALLAATVLCAQRRCRSVVDALIRQTANNSTSLPSWIHLEVECGAISVAARVNYSTTSEDVQSSTRPFVILFRLACDSRTGRYIPVFPRPASLLRLLACHDVSASDTQALRSVALANSRGSPGKSNDGSGREATGRIVRDAFDALSRSMDTLGRKCGVGGEWNDVDKQSSSLREKSVDQSCRDVMVSLMSCCGMAAVFGVGAIALKIACGVDPAADIAGGPIKQESSPGLLNVPPLSVVLGQRMIEKVVKEADGETKRIQELQGELFSVTAKVNQTGLDLVCYDVLTIVESASAAPKRLKYASVVAKDTPDSNHLISEPPSKKAKTSSSSNAIYHHTLDEVKDAVNWFDSMIRQ